MSSVSKNKLGITNESDLAIAEAEYSSARIAELVEKPIIGKFDVDHLRAIHHHIFQDIYPTAGFFHTSDQVRTKNRVSELTGQRHIVLYPPIQIANCNINDFLKRSVAELKSSNDVSHRQGKLIDIYAELDYFHPFADGNSRTLRVFTRDLANQMGLDLNWGTSNLNETSRDVLYAARDKSVLRRIINDVHSEHEMKAISQTLFLLSKYQGLKEVVTPMFVTAGTELSSQKKDKQESPNTSKKRIHNSDFKPS